MSQTNTKSGRSYPRTCTQCRQKRVLAVVIDRPMEVKYEGVLHSIVVRGMPAERCENCEATTFGNDADEAIDRTLREHLGLLKAEEIRDARRALGITQIALAAAIRCAKESVCRWESGQLIQSRAYDRLLRAYFGSPQVREMFSAIDRGEDVPVLVRAEAFASFHTSGAVTNAMFNVIADGQTYSSVPRVTKFNIQPGAHGEFPRLVREKPHAA